MPELPEVETVRRGLEQKIKNKVIDHISLRRAGLRKPFPEALKTLRQVKVIKLRRRAKYVLIDLDNKQTLILHLGMSGRMLIHEGTGPYKPEKHDHVVFHFKNGMILVFSDPRRFGILDLAPTKGLEGHSLFGHLGPEPLDPEIFTGAYLLEAFQKKKKTPVKVAVMNQEVVVGVGNIYASEALFVAKIDPRRAASSLTRAECRKLTDAIRAVLEKSITAGGSSLRDYVQTDGELGYFQHHFAVYGRDGEICTRCARSKKDANLVQKITQGGRSTFFCAQCQV